MSIIEPSIHVGKRPDGTVRLLRHNQVPFRADRLTGPVGNVRALAEGYVAAAAPDYSFEAPWLSTLSEGFEPALRPEAIRLRRIAEKSVGNLRTVTFCQSFLGLPVWQAGISTRSMVDRRQVLSSSSTVHLNIDLRFPGRQPVVIGDAGDEAETLQTGGRLLAPNDPSVNVSARPATSATSTIVDGGAVADLDRLEAVLAAAAKDAATGLGKLARKAKGTKLDILSERPLVYRYDPAARYDPSFDPSAVESPPVLPLPEVGDQFQDGAHYLVIELRFALALPGWGVLNWTGFWEASTGTVLYLRAHVHGVDGMVFTACPARQTGDATMSACDPAFDLDPLRSTVALQGLTAPGSGTDQALSGTYVELSETDLPTVAAPTEPAGNDFSYSSVTDDFAATSAYHHLDQMYRMVGDFGFDIENYFDGTTFPIPVDHRGEGGNANAHHHGNGGGTTKYRFGLMDSPCTVGYSADPAPVIHEFGHSCLENNIDSGTFSWAHGIGDSLAVILLDPLSVLTGDDRFIRSPFYDDGPSGAAKRRHDREVADGWSWGGSKDDGNYQSTEILSTSLFRAYRSTGGDEEHGDPAVRLARRTFSARYLAFLLIGAVGSMDGAVPPAGPDDLATAMIDLDKANADFEGHPGGAFHKVIRWALEKQGLYGGDAPAVDLYIDDGRDGEYEWRQNFWNTTEIWNRLNPDGGTAHQTPIVGQTNYFYVNVKNRGADTATGVTVRAYHSRPSAGLVWPDDWQSMATPELPAPDVASGATVLVGPFSWTPNTVGHECLLASVSNAADASNTSTVNGPIPHWRLVPFDNNIAQRNVAPVAAADGDALVLSLTDRTFWVNNPYDRTVTVDLEVALPASLVERGWAIKVTSVGGARFGLGPRADREVTFDLIAGRPFTPNDIVMEDATIDLTVAVDNQVVGGMSYLLDPNLRQPPVEVPEDDNDGEDEDQTIRDLLDHLGLPSDGACRARLRSVNVDIIFRDDHCC